MLGGLIGLLGGKFMKDRLRETVQLTCGICVLFIAVAGAMETMLYAENGTLSAKHSILITLCLVLGAVIGEICNIEHLFEKFGEWLKRKTKSDGDNSFIDGFVTASLTVSVGAMAIIGSIKDGIYGDWSTLGVKSILDFIIILVMTCSLGKGCIFSAIPVLIFEGLMTAFAALIKPFMSETALSFISLIGSILIFCVGINLVWGKKIRVANLLPSIIFAFIFALLPIADVL